jgi:hypothetical protein
MIRVTMYRQTLPGHDLSVEQDTPDVPGDGYYYVRHRGVIQGRFRSLAQALKCYQKIKQTLDIAPPPPPAPVSVAEAWSRELESKSNKSLFWTDDDFARVDRKTRGRPKH